MVLPHAHAAAKRSIGCQRPSTLHHIHRQPAEAGLLVFLAHVDAGLAHRFDCRVERRFCAIPEYGNRVLRVACYETALEIRILTVFFDRDARRP